MEVAYALSVEMEFITAVLQQELYRL